MSEFQFPDPPPPNNPQRVPDDPPTPVPPYQPPPVYPQPSAPVPPGYVSPSAPVPPPYPPPAYPYPSAPVPPQYQTQQNYSQPYVSLPPSHQVPPGYGYQAPPIQTSPVYPMPAMPEPPNRRRSGLIAIIAGVLAVVVLIGAFGVVLALRNGGSGDAQSILNGAEQAPLHDVTFKITGSVGVGFSATNVQTNLSGYGKMTLNPLAMDITLSDSALSALGSSGNIEEILIGTDLYMNLGGALGGTFDKPWVKISLADVPGLSSLGSVLNTTNPFDYHKLRNVTVVGTDTIDGRQASHLHATLSLQDSGLSPSDQATATAIEKQAGITQSKITEDLWIFKDNSFPAKVTTHESITLNNTTSGTSISGTETTDETMTFTAWNSGVTVSPPPADQVSSGTDFLPTPTPGS